MNKDANGRPFIHHGQYRITEEDAAFLFGITVMLRPRAIAEVGTGGLRSLGAFDGARQFLKTTLNWSCEIYSCDINGFRVCCGMNEFPDAHVIHGGARVMVQKMAHHPDLVLIDGEHTYDAVKDDFEELCKVCAKPCIFIFHDTINYPPIGVFVREQGGLLLPAPRGMGMVRVG